MPLRLREQHENTHLHSSVNTTQNTISSFTRHDSPGRNGRINVIKNDRLKKFDVKVIRSNGQHRSRLPIMKTSSGVSKREATAESLNRDLETVVTAKEEPYKHSMLHNRSTAVLSAQTP